MNAQRRKAEELVYSVYDKLDKTGQNTDYYKAKFAKMSDAQFLAFCKRNLPFRFQYENFKIEPSMDDIIAALKVMGVPLLEKLCLPYLYQDSKGRGVTSSEAMVIYIHVKKMKQFITKKNGWSTGIDQRDMKTGMLVQVDKNGKTSDKEAEALMIMGLEKTLKEMSTWRADYMNAKSEAYQLINTTGTISAKDIVVSEEDSLSKNMLNWYLLGCHLYTNLLNQNYMLPNTLKDRQRKTEREV